MNNIFSNVILPSGGNLCPFLSSLYDGYRTKNLDIVVYKKENVRKPIKKILPRGSKIFCEPIKKDEQDVENNSDSVHSLEEEKAQEKFWEHIRKLSVNSSDIKSIDRDGEFFVDSRLILLSNSKKVYLRDDLSVIEISDYIDGKKNISEVGKKFPKRPVKKLENGDLIVLRTSGSGEYLYEVATELMNKDKKQDLKEKALGWKPILKEALKDYGSEKIYNKLKEKGHSLSYHQYIWIWTTDYVIGPKSKSLFKDLIHILFEDNYFRDPANQSTYANDRWNEMRLIIKYHITAGHLIRKSLLSKLKRLIEDGIQIIDAYYFTLAETGAGQMAIFRVSDVDSQSLKVPYSKIGTLLEIEE